MRFFMFMALLALVFGCNRAPAIERELAARRLAADLRLTFTHAADASTRAVLADSDEASIAFAAEAEGAKADLKRELDALGPMLRDLDAPEAERLDEFRGRFAAYDALDREVLVLAVENTNLKAQKLSFGPSRDASRAFQVALDAALAATGPNGRCAVQAQVTAAVVAVDERRAQTRQRGARLNKILTRGTLVFLRSVAGRRPKGPRCSTSFTCC